MNLQSTPMTFDFWSRLKIRLASDSSNRRLRLKEMFEPRKATVDTLTTVLRQTAETRLKIFSELLQLERLEVLLLEISSQLEQALHQYGIPSLDLRINCLTDLVALYEQTMTRLPCRLASEQEMAQAESAYLALKNAGHSEALTIERQRLCGITRNLFVVGQEDSTEYESAVRSLQTQLDQLQGHRQAVMAGTTLTFQMYDETDVLRPILIEFGVDMFEVAVTEEPASSETQSEARMPDGQPPAATEEPS